MNNETVKQYSGGCLCGRIRFRVEGLPTFPHLCSCKMCQSWSGAPVVAWVEFPLEKIKWTGPGGEPSFYQSSEKTARGFCATCGGTLCAVDEGYENISLTLACFDDASDIVPDEHYSFADLAPAWLRVSLGGNP